MTWISAPAVRFAMRQSLRWTHLAPALVVLGLLAAERTDNPGWIANIGLFAVVYALPHAAARLIETDRNGRLDHLRLTSQRSTQLFLSLALGWSGPWLLLGIAFLAMWPATRTLGLSEALMIGAVFGASVALSLLALTLPRGDTGIDARLVAVALVAVALTASAMQVTAIQSLAPRASGVRSVAILLLAVEAAVIAMCLRILPRTMARPALTVRTRRRPLRLLSVGWHPSLSRPFNLLIAPGMVLGLITSMLIAVIWIALGAPWRPTGQEWELALVISYMPLLVGAFVVSTAARADRDGGRFELLRLAPARPVVMLAGLAAGACLPFVAATLVAYVTTVLIWGRPPGAMLAVLLAALIVAPVAGLEGWKGRWPLTYTLPAVLLFSQWIPNRGPILFVEAGLILLVAWIPWAAAAAIWRRPEAPPLSGWMGTAAIACLTFALLSSGLVVNDVVPLSALLLIVTSFIVDPSRPRAIDRWGPGAAAAITTALMAFRAPYGPAETLVLVPLPAVCWWIGLRIHQWAWPAERWSVAARIGLAIYLSTGPHVERALFDYFATMPSGADRAFGEHRLRVYALLDALWLAMAMAIEGGHRWRTRQAARRRLVDEVS